MKMKKRLYTYQPTSFGSTIREKYFPKYFFFFSFKRKSNVLYQPNFTFFQNLNYKLYLTCKEFSKTKQR